MIALDQVVAPPLINMSDTVEMRIISMTNLTNITPTGWRFIGGDRDWSMKPDTLNRFVKKGLCRLCITMRGHTEIDHLAVRIDSPPHIAPLTTGANVCLIHILIYACAPQALFCSFG